LHQGEALRIYSADSYLALTNILTGCGLNMLDTYLNSPLQPSSTLFSLSALKIFISSAPQCTVHPGSSVHTQISQLRLFSSKTIIWKLTMLIPNLLQNIIIIQAAFHLNTTPLI